MQAGGVPHHEDHVPVSYDANLRNNAKGVCSIRLLDKLICIMDSPVNIKIKLLVIVYLA